jgi:hypothetical protein
MARDGVSGAPVPASFPFASNFDNLGGKYNVSPNLCAAIKYNETGLGTNPAVLEYGCTSSGYFPNGDPCGHGLMQLTSSWPPNWQDADTNIGYAITNFIIPAWEYWGPGGGHGGYTGDDLVRLIAASYNAGIGGAQKGHDQGNCDLYTTNNYAARALKAYQQLCAGQIPTGT